MKKILTLDDYSEIVANIECTEGVETHEIEIEMNGGTLFVDCRTETRVIARDYDCNWADVATDYEITYAGYWDCNTEEMVACEYDNKEFRRVA